MYLIDHAPPRAYPLPSHPHTYMQKLHLAEDGFAFQAEEIHALRKRVGEREQECQRLRGERDRHAMLLHGLKRELAAHRHKVGRCRCR